MGAPKAASTHVPASSPLKSIYYLQRLISKKKEEAGGHCSCLLLISALLGGWEAAGSSFAHDA